MNGPGARIGALAVMLVTSTFGARASADGGAGPLMVAVEVDGELGVDAGDVRAAIGAELRRPVVAPSSAPGVDAEDVLLVSISRERTVVSFRGAGHEDAARGIPTPAERAARLRTVAWLAGNLARDQVSSLVLAEALAPRGEPAAKVEPAPMQPTPAQDPSAAAPALSPPPVSDGDALQLRATAPARERAEPTWTVSLSGGATVSYARFRFAREGGPRLFDDSAVYHLEVAHRQAAGWLLGGAIDFGPAFLGPGYAVTAAVAQRRWRLRFEESFGLGFGRSYGRTLSQTVTSSSLTGQSSATTVTTADAPYVRAFVTAALPVWRSWDLVANLGLRGDPLGDVRDLLLEGTVGARFELP